MSTFEITTIIVAVVALLPIVPLFRWIDQRYTHMKDFNALKEVIYSTHIDSYEERIEKIDEEVAALASHEPRSEVDDAQLALKKSRRDKYIRKLSRIK